GAACARSIHSELAFDGALGRFCEWFRRRSIGQVRLRRRCFFLDEKRSQLDDVLCYLSQWFHFPREQNCLIWLGWAVDRLISNLYELVEGLIRVVASSWLKYPPRLFQYRRRIGSLAPDRFAQAGLQVCL